MNNYIYYIIRKFFESVDIGNTLEMNLVEVVDKNENIIDSYLEVISSKYK